MTGFIKPSEILAAQREMVQLASLSGVDIEGLEDDAQEFLKVHPVTKNKESKEFRKVNGVFVTLEAFEDAESLNRPLDEQD